MPGRSRIAAGSRPRHDPLAGALDLLRRRLPPDPPQVALVLGSGLGALADEMQDAVRVPFAEIPGFAPAGVHGHTGTLVVGTLERRRVVALAGRLHVYEGHSAAASAFPVRVVHALGARTLFVSNAAGGIRYGMRAGDLMLIADHINLLWRNPLVGPVRPGEVRFPDMSAPYDRGLLALLREVACETGVRVVEGVYVAVAGPAYETLAEVRMLRALGADATGMSTVPEVIQARALGMRVAGVSCVTNVAAGMSAIPPSHEEVLQVAAQVSGRFAALVRAFIGRLDDAGVAT